MKSFRILALLSTLATYFLIFVGGLVRVSGAGLGCPDWPKCFGSWIPPLSLADIPANIDFSQFNITLAWIEYSNRLVGVLLGLVIVALAIQAIRHFRPVKSILYPSIIAAILVAFEGWQGSAVVSSELRSILVSTHLLVALVIASLLIWVTIQAYAREQDARTKPRHYSKDMYVWLIVLYVVSIIQIVMGTLVRTAVETVQSNWPEMAIDTILTEAGSIVNVHMVAGNLVTIITVVAALWILKGIERPPVLIARSAKLLIGLAVLQAILGLALLWIGLVPLMRLYHLWLSAMQIGLILVLFAGLKLSDSLPEKSQHSLARLLVMIAISVCLLGLGGQFVIDQAESSRALQPEPTQIEATANQTE